MKKMLLTAAMVALFAPPVLAQGPDRDHRPEGQQGGRPAQAPAAAPAIARPSPPGQGQHHDDHRPGPNSGMAGPRPNNATTAPRSGNAMPGPRLNNATTGPRSGNVTTSPRPGFGPAGPRPGTQRDFSALHRNFTAPRRFRAPAYHRPPGFYVHRWSFGELLPTAFWVRDYWLSDYFDFGLAPPPPGTVWVRYGNDALLIDEYSGEIIQVEYNVFY